MQMIREALVVMSLYKAPQRAVDRFSEVLAAVCAML